MKGSVKAFPPTALWEVLKDGWKSIMTIEHSPLRKLHPQVAHMVFTILGFMWSGIFAIAIMDSITAFAVSAFAHIVVISGFFITFIVFNEADKRPEAFNNNVFKIKDGYHSYPRARQNLYVNGKKVELDPNDPGGEHE